VKGRLYGRYLNNAAAGTGWCCGSASVHQLRPSRGLAVIATRGSDGAPQAALVGITATRRGELVFDTSRSSRKYRNLSSYAQVALVVGWENEMTVQCEGIADIPTGVDRDRCLEAYIAQYPDGVERAHDHDIVCVRVRPSWLRYSDYRPGSFTVEEITLS
jgi:hypothetical protein